MRRGPMSAVATRNMQHAQRKRREREKLAEVSPVVTVYEDWQLIETAPKDGSLLLLCLFPHPGYIECPRKVGGYWSDRWNLFGASWKPTHWMPLPPPPSGT